MKPKITLLMLAGGKSRRFWPLTNKLLTPFLGENLINLQIKFFRKWDFEKIIIVGTTELLSAIKDKAVIKITQTGEGQAGAILSAKDQISTRQVLIVNADDVIAHELLQKFFSMVSANTNLLVGYRIKQYFPGGYLVLQGDKIIRIVEKPGIGKQPSDFVRLTFDYLTDGAHLISALKHTSGSHPDNWYEAALTQLMTQKVNFTMLPYSGVWLPLKYSWQTLDLNEYFLNNSLTRSQTEKTAQIHKTASITGKVVLGSNVKVMEYAKLHGPLYIGDGTIIGNHTLIRNSQIGKNCVVGFASEIVRSHVGDNCWFHSNFVGDSVVEDDVTFGAGAILANLRLDEKNICSDFSGQRINTFRKKFGAIMGAKSRAGVGAMIMPGVKVGAASVVGPGVILHEDLAAKKMCLVKQSQTIKDINLITSDRTEFRQKI